MTADRKLPGYRGTLTREVRTIAENAVKTLYLVPITFVAGEECGKVVGTISIKTDLEEAPITLSAYAAVARE